MLKSLARVGSVRLYRCIILGNSSLGVEHFAGLCPVFGTDSSGYQYDTSPS